MKPSISPPALSSLRLAVNALCRSKLLERVFFYTAIGVLVALLFTGGHMAFAAGPDQTMDYAYIYFAVSGGFVLGFLAAAVFKTGRKG